MTLKRNFPLICFKKKKKEKENCLHEFFLENIGTRIFPLVKRNETFGQRRIFCIHRKDRERSLEITVDLFTGEDSDFTYKIISSIHSVLSEPR